MPREFKKLHVVSVNLLFAMRKGNVARDAQPLQDDTTLALNYSVLQFYQCRHACFVAGFTTVVFFLLCLHGKTSQHAQTHLR